MNETQLKKLGFRKKGGSKTEWEVCVEVAPKNYISISILNINNEWMFSGIEIDGEKADEVRREFFNTFEMEEIVNFLEKY
jgi:hypothetical protein